MSVSDVSVNGFQDSKHSVENGVYRIILDRPTHRNAFSPTLYAEVKRGVLLGEGNPDVVCIVIEGSHGSFGAGGDLKVLLEILALPRDERLAKYIASYCDTTPIGPMLECTKPIIAKIDGLCLAGGLLVSLASDIAIASEGSKFGLPEAKVGLSDRYSATLLPRAIGTSRTSLCIWRIDARSSTRCGASCAPPVVRSMVPAPGSGSSKSFCR